ncbi:pentapeptide repeat-containing protein [Paenibacillus sp. FSL P4-0338]|uniref:pentapeptide repeat-containing protein n=1 Tax=unclassified Paenibacillus TaxID=185978 RepID=UPI0003E22937|nr:pentapeptide repeat-containing protein [Paenibacillus sp. FSL R7-269]ETT30086.1 putative low-complexity protein [Paenibacillus sp. FSL R7-269]
MNITNLIENHKTWAASNGQSGEKMDIEKASLSGLVVPHTNLSDAIIVESDFKKIVLHYSDLAGGYFLGSVFDEADLSDSMLSKAIFEYASMKHCVMRHCTAIKASFDDGDLVYADLTGADLRRASFQRTNLSHACFDEADLSYAHMDGAHLYHTTFVKAKGVDFIHADHIYIGSEDHPIKLEGEDVNRWLCTQTVESK